MPNKRRQRSRHIRSGRSKALAKRSQPLNRPLRLEPLEDRRMLAVMTVTSLSDGTLEELAGDGELSLREAIEAINTQSPVDGIGPTSGTFGTNDQVAFEPSLFDAGPQSIDLVAGELELMTAAAIVGPGSELLDIDADNRSRIFTIDDGTSEAQRVSISGLTARNGKAPDGGGIWNAEHLSLTDVQLISHESRGFGGGIYSTGELSLNSTSLLSNHAVGGEGGGIFAGINRVTVVESQINGNSATSDGGGIVATSLILRDSEVIGNQSNHYGGTGGAGVYARLNAEISDSIISGNRARMGHGAGVSGQTIEIYRSSIVDNRAEGTSGDGGGIYASANLTVVESVITGNTATGRGGGITAPATDNIGTTREEVVIERSSIRNNTAQFGGGVWSRFAVVSNSTISDNIATRDGGGMYSFWSDIDNSTISGNTAFRRGGAFRTVSLGSLELRNSTVANNTAAEGGGLGGRGQLENSIVANNTALDGPDILTGVTANFSIIGNPSGQTVNGANNWTNVDPLLGPLQDNGGLTFTHALLEGSLAYNAGDTGFGAIPRFDQRGEGFSRVLGGRIDIGAFEASEAVAHPAIGFDKVAQINPIAFDNGELSGEQGTRTMAGPWTIYEDFVLTEQRSVFGFRWTQRDHDALEREYLGTVLSVYASEPSIETLLFTDTIQATRTVTDTIIQNEPLIEYEYLDLNLNLEAGTYYLALHDPASSVSRWVQTTGADDAIPGRWQSQEAHSLGAFYSDENSVFEVVSADDSGVAKVGDVIDYELTATNTGNVSLTNVTVMDPSADSTPVLLGGDADGNGELSVGESWVFYASRRVTQNDIDLGGEIVNEAFVTTGETDAVSAMAAVPVLHMPAIAIEKQADLQRVDQAGQVINYTVTVTNEGNASLTGIEVADPTADSPPAFVSGDLDQDGELDVDETWEYSASYTVTQSDFESASDIFNVATVTALGGVEASASATVSVAQVWALTVTSEPNVDSVSAVGELITYEYTLQNVGNQPLTAVNVSDPALAAPPLFVGGDLDNDQRLDLGESWTLAGVRAVTQADLDAGGVSSTVEAQSAETSPVSATAIVAVDQQPAVAVAIDVTQIRSLYQGLDAVYDDLPFAYSAGDVIEYEIAVTSEGNISLSGVALTDPQADAPPVLTSGDADGDGELDVDETWIFTATRTVTQEEIDAGGSVVLTAVARSDQTSITGALASVDVRTPDFDLNRQVDGADFLLQQRGYGKPDAGRTDGDADADGDVDREDVAAWETMFGAPAIDLQLATPSTVSSSTAATDFYPAENLINDSGLSDVVTLANFFEVTHQPHIRRTAWATDSPSGPGSDYFAAEPPVVMTFDFADLESLTAILVWGYGGVNRPINNDVQQFTLEFSTDGGDSYYDNVALEKPRTINSASRLSLGGQFEANYVRMTITDNHFGTPGATGGDRVGISEVKFLALEHEPGATTFVVDTELDIVDPTDGLTSLREAVAQANDLPGPDEISFDFGHDGPAVIRLEQGELLIADALTITGDGPELLTIDAGDGADGEPGTLDGSRVFRMDDGTGDAIPVEISGLTITGGDVPGYGGGILNAEQLTLTNTIVTGNAARGGGGIFTSNGITLSDSQVNDNTAVFYSGGGIRSTGGDVVITRSEIARNTAEWEFTPSPNGGGISSQSGEVLVADSTISDNAASGRGGGIDACGRVEVLASTINGNTAGAGGGGIGATGRLEVLSSQITGNAAYHGGRRVFGNGCRNRRVGFR